MSCRGDNDEASEWDRLKEMTKDHRLLLIPKHSQCVARLPNKNAENQKTSFSIFAIGPACNHMYEGTMNSERSGELYIVCTEWKPSCCALAISEATCNSKAKGKEECISSSSHVISPPGKTQAGLHNFTSDTSLSKVFEQDAINGKGLANGRRIPMMSAKSSSYEKRTSYSIQNKEVTSALKKTKSFGCGLCISDNKKQSSVASKHDPVECNVTEHTFRNHEGNTVNAGKTSCKKSSVAGKFDAVVCNESEETIEGPGTNTLNAGKTLADGKKLSSVTVKHDPVECEKERKQIFRSPETNTRKSGKISNKKLSGIPDPVVCKVSGSKKKCSVAGKSCPVEVRYETVRSPCANVMNAGKTIAGVKKLFSATVKHDVCECEKVSEQTLKSPKTYSRNSVKTTAGGKKSSSLVGKPDPAESKVSGSKEPSSLAVKHVPVQCDASEQTSKTPETNTRNFSKKKQSQLSTGRRMRMQSQNSWHECRVYRIPMDKEQEKSKAFSSKVEDGISLPKMSSDVPRFLCGEQNSDPQPSVKKEKAARLKTEVKCKVDCHWKKSSPCIRKKSKLKKAESSCLSALKNHKLISPKPAGVAKEVSPKVDCFWKTIPCSRKPENGTLNGPPALKSNCLSSGASAGVPVEEENWENPASGERSSFCKHYGETDTEARLLNICKFNEERKSKCLSRTCFPAARESRMKLGLRKTGSCSCHLDDLGDSVARK